MTIRERITEQRKREFEEQFDLATFEKYVESMVSRFGYVKIALCDDNKFENGSLKSVGQFEQWSSPCTWLAFARGYEHCGERTNCQAPARFCERIGVYLNSQGLSVSFRGNLAYHAIIASL
jgi:hypothetical protein